MSCLAADIRTRAEERARPREPRDVAGGLQGPGAVPGHGGHRRAAVQAAEAQSHPGLPDRRGDPGAVRPGRPEPSLPWLDYVTVDNPQEIAQLAEFGVVFLLFMIGLELSWERLRLMRKLVFGLGALQMIGCSLALGGIAMALGQQPVAP